MAKFKGDIPAQMRRVRELAMQVLCVFDAHSGADAETARQIVADGAADEDLRRLALEMANGAWDGRQISDQWIERLAPQWPPHRQPVVDRNILRLAVWELTNRPTPPKAVIDEAIELAKAFSTDRSASFVNGVIDAVLKEHQSLIAFIPAPIPSPIPSLDPAPTDDAQPPLPATDAASSPPTAPDDAPPPSPPAEPSQPTSPDAETSPPRDAATSPSIPSHDAPPASPDPEPPQPTPDPQP